MRTVKPMVKPMKAVKPVKPGKIMRPKKGSGPIFKAKTY